MAKDLVTKIILKGSTDPSLTRAFQVANSQVDGSLAKLQSYATTASKLMKGTAVVIGTGLATATKCAIDYESAFAGVKKTVEETDTTTYEDISNAIRNMAKTMPATTTEIAAVAEAAGQLGIKADDIEKFTEIMIMLGTTTNLASDEAATAIAKMFNITGTSMQDVDRFGATIVALGNNAATTESDIVNMAMRIASSATQIGMTEQELLALATSLSSVGLEAEGGGTAISTIMTQIDKSVALNSENLSIWAETAGMTAEQFKSAWETDAYGAMQKIISGMGDVNKDGGNLNLLLDELGIKGIRTSDTMKRLSNASGLMSEMTDLANQAWSENTALATEANTRYSTMASRIQVLKNRLYDVGITVGEALLPHLETLMNKLDEINWDKVADGIVDKINWVIEHFDEIKVALSILAVAFATFKTAEFVGAINDAAGALSKMFKIASESGGFTAFSTKLSGLGTNLSGMFKGLGATVGGTFKTIGAGLAGITAPVWIAIAVIAVLVAGFVTLWKTNQKFKDNVIGIWNDLKEKFSSFGSGIVDRINELGFNFESIGDIVSSVANGIKTAWQFLCDWLLAPTIMGIFNTISTMISGALDTILGVVDIFVGLFTGDWEQCWTGIKEIVGGLAQIIFAPLISSFKTFKQFWGLSTEQILNWFKQLPSKIWNWLKQTYQKIVTWGTNLVSKGKETGTSFVTSVVNWFKALPSKAWTWLVNIVTKIVTWRAQMIAKAKEVGLNFVNAVVNFFKQLPYRIGYAIGFVIGKLAQWGLNLINWATTNIPIFINNVVNFFKQLPSKIWTWLKNVILKVILWSAQMQAKAIAFGIKFITSVVNFFKQLPSKVWTWLLNVVNKVGYWTSTMIAKAIALGSQFLSSVISFFQQLPSKIWTVFTECVQKVITWGTQLATKGKLAAVKLFVAIVTKLQELPAKLLEIGGNIVEGLWNGINNAKDWLVGKVKDFASGILDGIKDAMGINSPSKITTSYGKFIGQGLGIGIQKTQAFVGKAVGKMNDVVTGGLGAMSPVISPVVGAVSGSIQKFATGGTVTKPQYAVVGDAPETIVPHGNTPRNRALLNEAAEGVGASFGNSTVINVSFAPVINGGNAEENRRMLQEEEEAFERKMDEYFEKKARLAF